MDSMGANWYHFSPPGARKRNAELPSAQFCPLDLQEFSGSKIDHLAWTSWFLTFPNVLRPWRGNVPKSADPAAGLFQTWFCKKQNHQKSKPKEIFHKWLKHPILPSKMEVQNKLRKVKQHGTSPKLEPLKPLEPSVWRLRRATSRVGSHQGCCPARIDEGYAAWHGQAGQNVGFNDGNSEIIQWIQCFFQEITWFN